MKTELTYLGVEDSKGFPPHSHDCYEILYYIDVEGLLQTDRGDLILSSGNIAILPPGTTHKTISKKGFTAIAISGTFGNFLQFEKPLLICDNAEHDAEALVRMLYRNRLTPGDYLNALTDALLHFILQNNHPENALTQAVRQVANILSERFYDSSLSPAEFLNESGYAEDYIRAHFKKVIGKTPNGFLNSIRIDHARYLIENYNGSLSLSEISERCGFSDYVYFSKKFKELVGCSPNDYKKGL